MFIIIYVTLCLKEFKNPILNLIIFNVLLLDGIPDVFSNIYLHSFLIFVFEDFTLHS